jgi:predicted ATPase/DNA-binding winged helix-turn-helix (wHTH) protein
MRTQPTEKGDRGGAKKHGFSAPPLRVDAANAQAWRGKQLLTLRPRAFAVLRYLSEHPGQLVTKDEVIQAVWMDTVVTDDALVACVLELRKALQDDAQRPRYIETVHRRGYRFIGQVVSGQSSVVSPPPAPLLRPQLATGNWQLTTNLIGRESELAQLHQWLEKTLRGERQLIFVTGEPGIGKTTLVKAFAAGIEQLATDKRQEATGNRQRKKTSLSQPMPVAQSLMPGVWLGWGQCIEQYGAGEPYLPVLEALGRLCRGPDGERLIALLQQHAPTWLAQMPALLSSTAYEALQHKTQGATRERMLREIVEALEVIAAERPLVLVLEDLHWSDPSTLDLLSMAARRSEPARLLLIGTYRPLDVIIREHPLKTVKQELQLHNYCRELALEPLSEAQVAEYLAMRFEVGAHSRASLRLVQLIAQRTEGNPLFLVSVVDDLIARGMFMQTDTGWELKEEAATIESRIPDSIRQLVALQSGRLSPAEQQTLEAASIAGMEFSAAAVAAALATNTAVIEQHCEHLVERQQFLRRLGVAEWPDGTLAARYGFLHALYQQLWHERVSPAQLQHYHLQIGKRKEHAYGERVREIAVELAVHFEQGGVDRKAIHYLQQAGENAVRCSAYQEATSHFTKGLELLKTFPDTPTRTQQELLLLKTLGPALMAAKGYAAPDVAQAYTRARELCQQVRETPRLLSVLLGLETYYAIRAQLQTARELGEQCLPLAQRMHDLPRLLQTHFGLEMALFHLGEFALAREHFEQSVALYQRQKHGSHRTLLQDPGVACLSYAALVLWSLGYPEQALKRSYEALTLAHELSHPFSLAVALNWTAWFHQYRREEQLTQERAEAEIALASEQGFPFWTAWGTIHRGWALAEQGQEEEGLMQIHQGLAAYQAMGSELVRPWFLALLAEAYGKEGQTEEGLAVLAEALDAVDKSGERFCEAELYRLKGQLTLQQQCKVQNPECKIPNTQHPTPSTHAEAVAETCFLKAIGIARKQQAKSWELRATTSLARLWQKQGKQHEARSTLSEIYNWFTEGFDTKDLQGAKALLQELA